MGAPKQRFYDAACERPFLIQRVCAYLRTAKGGDGECSGCPAEEPATAGYEEYGSVKRMCRALAEEVIAIVLEDIERPADLVVQDN